MVGSGVKPAGATKSYGAGTKRAGVGVANSGSEKSAGDERGVSTCLTFLCSDGDTINEMAGQFKGIFRRKEKRTASGAVLFFTS